MQHTWNIRSALRRSLAVEEGESPALAWSLLYSFLLSFSYYVLRPVRDEVGAQDADNLQLLWTGTFVGMLLAVPFYSILASRLPRQVFLALVYRIFILVFLLFFALFRLVGEGAEIWVGRAFYVWLSVFNLFCVTSFWGFMVDLYRDRECKRLFGLIATGWTLGQLAGSWFTAGMVASLGTVNLFLVPIVLLEGVAQCVRRLHRHFAARETETLPEGSRSAAEEPVGGSVLESIAVVFRSPYLLKIASYVFLMTLASTFLYFLQSHMVRAALPDRVERTELFAKMNLVTGGLTLVVQSLLVGRLIRRAGMAFTLCVLPALSVLGFLCLGVGAHFLEGEGQALSLLGVQMTPILAILVVFQLLQRSTRYAVAKPAREVLFSVVRRRQKYKSKAFIDTVVYRGSDALQGWVVGLLINQLTLGVIALIAAPFALLWASLGITLGRRQSQIAAADTAAEVPETSSPAI